MARPPEPTPGEAQRILEANEAVKARYGGGCWGTATKPMREVWGEALLEGVVSAADYELVRRDAGEFWNMTLPGEAA